MTLLLKQSYDLALMPCRGILLVALADTNLVKFVRINHVYLFTSHEVYFTIFGKQYTFICS